MGHTVRQISREVICHSVRGVCIWPTLSGNYLEVMMAKSETHKSFEADATFDSIRFLPSNEVLQPVYLTLEWLCLLSTWLKMNYGNCLHWMRGSRKTACDGLADKEKAIPIVPYLYV